MSPDNLGATTHRYPSPLVGLFPGDRIRPDGRTPTGIVDGAATLFTACGRESSGRADAWRGLCRVGLKNAGSACGPAVDHLRPSSGGGYGTAPGPFGTHPVGQRRGGCPNDAGSGTCTATIDMSLPSRSGCPELLPALPDACTAYGSGTGTSTSTGVRTRCGFVVGLHRRDGTPTEAKIHSVGGRTTTTAHDGSTRTVRPVPGASVTRRDSAR